MYQLPSSCAGFMMRFFMKTRGCGTLNIAVRLILSEYRAAARLPLKQVTLNHFFREKNASAIGAIVRRELFCALRRNPRTSACVGLALVTNRSNCDESRRVLRRQDVKTTLARAPKSKESLPSMLVCVAA